MNGHIAVYPVRIERDLSYSEPVLSPQLQFIQLGLKEVYGGVYMKKWFTIAVYPVRIERLIH